MVCEETSEQTPESAAVSSPECGAAAVTGVISSREWAVECGLYEQVGVPPPHLQVKESARMWCWRDGVEGVT